MYNIIVFALSALVLAGIVQLLAAIIRDHQD
jgi:capsule polysaccharide export protein KpsE/RkpR